MFIRSLSALAIALGLCAATEAAQVKSFVVKCVDRQEVSSDDVYLAGVRDGSPVAWGDAHQSGTSSANSINLTDGGSMALDAKSLAELKFDRTLQITIKEKDVTGDEVIGVVNIAPGDGSKKQIFKSDDFEYHVEYVIE